MDIYECLWTKPEDNTLKIMLSLLCMIEQDVLHISGDCNSQENYGKVIVVHWRNKACVIIIPLDFKIPEIIHGIYYTCGSQNCI